MDFIWDHFIAIMATFIAIIALIGVWLVINELRTRGPAVAHWTAIYSKNSDGTGERMRESGTYYANRTRYIPSTIEVTGEFDFMFWIITKIPRWKHHTYYVVADSVEVTDLHPTQ